MVYGAPTSLLLEATKNSPRQHATPLAFENPQATRRVTSRQRCGVDRSSFDTVKGRIAANPISRAAVTLASRSARSRLEVDRNYSLTGCP